MRFFLQFTPLKNKILNFSEFLFINHYQSYMINNPSLAYTKLEKQLSTIIKRLNATEGRITLILSHLIGYDSWRRPHPEKNNSKGNK